PVDGWDQLVYAVRGVLSVETAQGSWVLPAERALWVPAGTEHQIEIPGPVSLRSLYLPARISRGLPRSCCTVNISPLLRELILYAVNLGALDGRVPQQDRLIGVILDQLKILKTVPLQLPMPRDKRALMAVDLMRADPSERRSPAVVAGACGA